MEYIGVLMNIMEKMDMVKIMEMLKRDMNSGCVVMVVMNHWTWCQTWNVKMLVWIVDLKSRIQLLKSCHFWLHLLIILFLFFIKFAAELGFLKVVFF